MKKMTANEIRQTWFRFFENKGHSIEPGASLVPHNDPTLLWINSGVAALKKYFDGSEMPKNKRITNVQKSIRTNDIENVGMTSRHHTFFEMLGNFSIGDYFRKEMIAFAFEILTSEDYFAIPQDLIYITYNPTDLDTLNCWLSLGIKEEHLIPLEGNYWQIGEGPCGPNTEVFFDRGDRYDPEHIGLRLLKEDLDNDRYIEIWGIVFSQFNAVEGVERKDYKELPSKNIDTGAGLERIASCLQDAPTNFETDLFMPIILATEKLAKHGYKDAYKMAYRVIADHIRTCTFALSDGASFSNEGRGYVLRRILRRAMRFGRKLEINGSFLYKLVPVVVDIMKEFYPYLIGKQDFVAKMIKTEEERFLLTLTTGEALLRKTVEDTNGLTGEDAFKLYDTYGFPFELTREICSELGVKVDAKSFEVEMEKQRERARSARSNLQSMNKQSKDLMDFVVKSDFDYENNTLKGKVVGLFIDGKKVESIDEEGDVILDITSFYAESGGQISDIGIMENEQTSAKVLEVIKAPNAQHLHHIQINYGTIKLGDELVLKIDTKRRIKIMRNHSAAHLLQSALVKVLGNHVHQEGSYVSDEYLRFDFTHFDRVKEDQIREIEEIVNEYINEAIEENTRVMPLEMAKKIGATALFNEKYGEIVRVVTFGDVSLEFCGGTHVLNTEDIGCFVIEFEESIASGIRRIQACTGNAAYRILKARENLLITAKDQLRATSIYEVGDRLKSLISEKDNLKKENSELLLKQANLLVKTIKDEFVVFNGMHLLIKNIEKTNRASLMKIIDELKVIHEDSVIVLTGEEDSLLPIVVQVGAACVKRGLHAGNIVKEISTVLEGSGGGRPDLASGSGKNKDKLVKVVSLVKKLID